MPLAAPVVASIIGAIGSTAGGALANRGSQTASTSPTLSPEFQGLQGQVLKMIQGRLGTDPNLAGYTGSGVSQINNGFNLAKQASDNNLTARGLATSPIAANVDATREAGRASAVTGFRNSIPLLSRELQTQDLGLAGNVLNMGHGSTSTGTTASGGGAAGAFTNLAQYLGYLHGKGAFGGGQQGLYPVGGNGTNYAPSPTYGEGY